MYHYIAQGIGLHQISDSDRLIVFCLLYLSCTVIGIFADLLLGRLAFGPWVNGVLLLGFFVAGLLIYNRFLFIRHAGPMQVLGIAVLLASVLFLTTAALKNRLVHS